MNLNNVPVIFLVALCWMSVGTFAQTTLNVTMTPMMTSNSTMHSTAMGGTNNTTAPATTSNTNSSGNTTPVVTGGSNMTTAGSHATTAGSNMTTAGSNMTTAGSNMTTAGSHATTAGSNMTTAGSNMTTAGSNATTAGSHATTAGSNMTTAGSNMTTAGSNATTAGSNMTTAAATTAAATTTAPPIVTNITVTTLQSNISRNGCGTERLCASSSADCDPSSSSSCPFVGIKRISGQNMEFELAGTTTGYVAAALQPASGGNETTYICVKNGTEVTFRCATLMNGIFTDNSECPANNVKAKIIGSIVQCSFDATVPDGSARRRNSATTFSVSVLTGSVNATTGALNSPNRQLQTAPVDLTVPSSNTNNTATTAAPTVSTTGGAFTLQQSISRALLIILGIVSLGWL